MRASNNPLYALAIPAWVLLTVSCGNSSPSTDGNGSLPLCSDPNRKADSPCTELADGGDISHQTDAGPLPHSPCRGYEVPKATKCQIENDLVTCSWSLKPGENATVCYLNCDNPQNVFGWCIMKWEYSGAEKFHCTFSDPPEWVVRISCTDE